METQTIYSLSEVKELIIFCNENNLNKREIFDRISENSFEIKKYIKSFKERYIGERTTDFLEDSNFYYCSDDYNICHNGEILHNDDSGYCEYSDEYYPNDEIVQVNMGRSCEYWSISNAERYAHEYNGDFYTENGLDYNDLVFDVNGEIGHRDDLYFWDSDGEWHQDPEEEEQEKYVNDYHSGRYKEIMFTDEPKFKIGYEIEKEDQDVKESLYISDFEDNCPKWRKERDGSLNSNKGYELISPTFELNVKEIEKHIRENKTLVEHINAEISKSCGGHINVSEVNLTGQELFDKVKGYNALFYALYYKRVDKDYCKGKSNEDLKGQNEKYQAIRIHDNRIEYRIISAVPNINTLIWRTKLIEFILNNPTSCPKDAFFKVNTSPLKELLQEMYPNEKFQTLIDRLIRFTQQFEQIKLTNN